jgi:predicted SnoaL-like aldol condensation-catalyzing enzyme
VGTGDCKRVLRRIIEDLINARNLDLAEELFAAEHELHPETAGIGRGPEGMKLAFAGLVEEFPDIAVELESMIAEGDVVAARLTFRGTHASSGEPATWPEAIFVRFSDGKAAESWEVADTGRSWTSPPW